MAQPDRSGLSNPYAPPRAVAARPRTGLARVAVLAGVGGAATLGLAGPAAAAPSAALPVSPYDDGIACYRLDKPVTHGAAPRPRDPVMHGATAGVERRLLPVRRCGVPAAWWRTRPVRPAPEPVLPPPVDADPVPPPADDPLAGSELVLVDGTVEAGVEPGCTVLRGDDGGTWTLVGPLSTLPYGVGLTVEGVTTPDLMSTCQQGEVLRVRQVALQDGEDQPAVPVATTDRIAAGARPIPVRRVYPAVDPACGPTEKIPTTTLCTR